MISTFAHFFTPRSSNNHRPKLLHPVGLAAVVGLVLIFHSSLELIKASPPRGFVLGYASNISTEQVFQATNLERAKIGLPPLNKSQNLALAAKAKAQHMLAVDYWDHIGPNGTTPWYFIKQEGYKYSVAGENLARDFDTTQPMIKAWMESPTHKANIVHDKYQDTGVAVINGKLGGVETTLVVQMFGKPTLGLSNNSPSPPSIASGTQSPLEEPQGLSNDSDTPSVLSKTESSPQTYISPNQAKKTFGASVVGVLIAILIVDEIIIRNKKAIRFVGKNWAHIGFMTVILLIILSFKPGGIL